MSKEASVSCIDFTKYKNFYTALDNGYKVLKEITNGNVIYIQKISGKLKVMQEEIDEIDLSDKFLGNNVIKHLIMQKKIKEMNEEKYRVQDILNNNVGRNIEADIKTSTFKVAEHYREVDLVLDLELTNIKTISIFDYSDGDKTIDISNLVCEECESIMFMFHEKVKGNKKIIGLDNFLKNVKSDKLTFIVDVKRNGYGQEKNWLNIDFEDSTAKAYTVSIRNDNWINVDVKVNIDCDDVYLGNVKYEGKIKARDMKLERVDLIANTSIDNIYITDGAKGEIKNDKEIKGTNLDRIYNTMLDVYEGKKKKDKSRLYFGADYKKYNLIWRMKADEKKFNAQTFFIETIGGTTPVKGHVRFRYIQPKESDIPNKPIYDLSLSHESYYKE